MKRAAIVGISLALEAVSLVGQSGSGSAPAQNQPNPFEGNGSPPSLVRKFVQQQVGRSPRVVQNPQSFVFTVPRTSDCPVALHALQGSGRGLLRAKKDRGNFGSVSPTQHIHFAVADPNATRARVQVFGHSDRKRFEQTQLSNFEMGELGRTLDVTLSPENDGAVAADLVLPGFTSVKSIRLESITYEDGSTWSLGTGQSCQIAPDRLMLVADR